MLFTNNDLLLYLVVDGVRTDRAPGASMKFGRCIVGDKKHRRAV